LKKVYFWIYTIEKDNVLELPFPEISKTSLSQNISILAIGVYTLLLNIIEKKTLK